MWQFLPANEKIQVSYHLLITHCAKIPSLGKSKQRVVSRPQDPKDKMRSNIIKGHFRAPIEVHPLLSLNSRYISIGNHSQCAQSQPSFLSTNWTYHLKFALTTIISKSFFHETETVRSLYAGFCVGFAMFRSKHWDIFKRFILSYLYVTGAVCVRVHGPVFWQAITGKKTVSGVWEILLQALWAAWAAAWIRTLVLMMKPCFPHYTASQVYHFLKFLFPFLFSSLSCFMSPLHCILLFYILSFPFMYSRSLVSVWK